MAEITADVIGNRVVLTIDGQDVTYWFKDSDDISEGVNRFALIGILRYLVNRVEAAERRIEHLESVMALMNSLEVE